MIDELSPYKLKFVLRIKATQPSDKVATLVTAKFALPKETATVVFDLPKSATHTQSAEHNPQSNTAEWQIKKFNGG